MKQNKRGLSIKTKFGKRVDVSVKYDENIDNQLIVDILDNIKDMIEDSNCIENIEEYAIGKYAKNKN